MSTQPRHDVAASPIEGPPTEIDVAPTWFIDHDTPAVRAWALAVAGDAEDDAARARRLFAAVRDGVRYDPYRFSGVPENFRASAVLASEGNWCVPKSVLLAAGARAVGIPARLGFADVRNHLSSEKLRARMGTDLFVWHGYAALHVGGAWRKASPAFNADLCERFGVPALEFDGRSDALLHAYDGEGRRHMEYVDDHGTWTDLPLERIHAALAGAYPGLPFESGADHDAAFHG